MKLNIRNLTIYFIIFAFFINSCPSAKMKTNSRNNSRFRLGVQARKKMLADLWKAPGTPKSPELQGERKAAVDGPNVLFEDWMNISSATFKDESKFPVFYYPGGGIGEALLTPQYMRINEKFQDTPPNLKQGEWTPDPTAPPNRTYFWFRLSEKYLYFAESKESKNILGSFRWADNTLNASRVNPMCFELVSKSGEKFDYCSKTSDMMKKMLCHIQTTLRIDIDKICRGGDNTGPVAPVKPVGVIKEKIITQPYILIPLARGECNEDWTYRERGSNWECLCKEGMAQSPIDLPPPKKAIGSPIKAFFQFDKTSIIADEPLEEHGIKIGDNLQLRYHDGTLRIFSAFLGKTVTMDGAVYHAKEISFHIPSEHTINGEKFPMEMNIVHYGQSIGDTAKQLVISILFQKSPGVYNKFLESLDIFNLPNPLDKFRDLDKDLFIPDIFFNVNEVPPLAMPPFSFYTYEGSLTKPPCAEKTIHYVSSEPIGISSTVIELFKEALRIPDVQTQDGQRQASENSILWSNRAVQKLNGRSVFFFDSKKYACPTPKMMRKGSAGASMRGHYERKEGKVDEFFFVEGDKPSGLPGAFVVTENEAKDSLDALPDPSKPILDDDEEDERKEGKLV